MHTTSTSYVALCVSLNVGVTIHAKLDVWILYGFVQTIHEFFPHIHHLHTSRSTEVSKIFQSFTVICCKPHLASSICLRATIFQNPEGTLWTHCTMRVIEVGYQYSNCYIVFTQTPAWLTEMIEHPTWRSLIYRLAEEYPDCLMLNFTIKV
jgi:hypothetical protein